MVKNGYSTKEKSLEFFPKEFLKRTVIDIEETNPLLIKNIEKLIRILAHSGFWVKDYFVITTKNLLDEHKEIKTHILNFYIDMDVYENNAPIGSGEYFNDLDELLFYTSVGSFQCDAYKLLFEPGTEIDITILGLNDSSCQLVIAQNL